METDRKIKTNIWCQPCIAVDKVWRKAVAFCVGCADYLCTNCNLEHGKNKQSRNHTILRGNDMPRDCKLFKNMKRLMTCQLHQEIEISYKCEDHDTFVCVKCLAGNHRGCENIQDVCNVDVNSGDLVTLLKEECTTIKTVLTTKHENIAWMASEKTRIEKERKEFVEKVNKHMFKLIEASREHTDTAAKNVVRDLKREIHTCTELTERHDYYQDLLEISMKHGTYSEKITVTDFVRKELQRLSKEIEELSNGKFACLRFEPTTQFEGILSFGDILVDYIDKEKATSKLLLGVSSDEFTEQEIQPHSKVSNSMYTPSHPALNKGPSAQAEKNMCEQKHSQTSFMSRQVSKKSTQKVRIYTDKQVCSVNGIVIIEGKCYIATDCNNMTVKLLQNDFTVSESIILEARPIDICKAGNTKVAVLSKNRKILIFDINKASISLTAIYNTMLEGLSITCDIKKQDFIIMFLKEGKENSDGNKSGEIHIRSLQDYDDVKGETSTFITKIGCTSPLPNSASIHFSNTRKLFISAKKRVYCLSIPSVDTLPAEDWFYKQHGTSMLKDVSYIDTDNEGNAYICGKTSCNIHQVSGKKYNNNRVLISNITKPLSVCVDSQNEVLLVGCEGDDYLHVYKFQ